MDCDQREGMGTLSATDEELIARVREILDEKQLIVECVKEAILAPEFVGAVVEAFHNAPIKKPTFNVSVDGQLVTE